MFPFSLAIAFALGIIGYVFIYCIEKKEKFLQIYFLQKQGYQRKAST